LLLLLGILAHHLIFKSLHFLLSLEQSSLFVYGEDHIGLSLLLLEVLDASHLSVFVDHALDDVVDLLFFLKVFLLCFGLQLLMLIDLALDAALVLNAVLETGCLCLTIDLVLYLLSPQHDLVDLGVLLLKLHTVRVLDFNFLRG
jgi:hypothetical protein